MLFQLANGDPQMYLTLLSTGQRQVGEILRFRNELTLYQNWLSESAAFRQRTH